MIGEKNGKRAGGYQEEEILLFKLYRRRLSGIAKSINMGQTQEMGWSTSDSPDWSDMMAIKQKLR